MASDVTVYVLTAASAPIQGAWVGLYRSSTLARVQSDTTDVNGSVVFPAVDESLDGGVYQIRVNPGDGSEVVGGNRKNITVLSEPTVPPASNIFDVTVTPPSTSTATNPNFCRCSGYIQDSYGAALGSRVVDIFMLEGPAALYSTANGLVTSIAQTATGTQSSSSGFVSVDLIRGALYAVRIPGFTDPLIAQIPDSSSAQLADVLFPTVGTIKWYSSGTQLLPTTAPTTTLAAGSSITLDIVPLLRSGVATTVDQVSISSNDEAVATVEISADSVIITGIAAGSAVVSAARVTGENTITLYPEQSIVGSLSVTVT